MKKAPTSTAMVVRGDMDAVALTETSNDFTALVGPRLTKVCAAQKRGIEDELDQMCEGASWDLPTVATTGHGELTAGDLDYVVRLALAAADHRGVEASAAAGSDALVAYTPGTMALEKLDVTHALIKVGGARILTYQASNRLFTDAVLIH